MMKDEISSRTKARELSTYFRVINLDKYESLKSASISEKKKNPKFRISRDHYLQIREFESIFQSI